MADWYKLTTEDSLEELDADLDGLTAEDAQKRLETHGSNELEEKGTRGAWFILLEQFAQTMVIILVVAAAIAQNANDAFAKVTDSIVGAYHAPDAADKFFPLKYAQI